VVVVVVVAVVYHVKKRYASHRVRKGIRFIFRNHDAEPISKMRALVYERKLVGVTRKNPETPSGDPRRVFFSV